MVPPNPQLHMLLMQVALGGHVVPQPPQFLGSDVGSTQVVPQSVGVLGGHEQAPLSQTIPGAGPAHAVPFVAGVVVVGHPVAGTHAPATWHCGAGHGTSVPVQAPFWHVSPWRHKLPASHAVPFVTAGGVHMLVTGLHVPAVWH
jgi:hypothetical protein